MEEDMNEDVFQSTSMVNPRVGRRTYLVTYSKADTNLFPTRQSFGVMLEKYFNAGSGTTKVLHWACCQEKHQDGHLHYHAALKLSHSKKWVQVKKSILQKEKISINFSDHHSYYIAAYKYVCKSDSDVFHSEGDPNLKNISSPKTKLSTLAYRQSRKRTIPTESSPSKTLMVKESGNNKKKPCRLSNLDVSDFIVENQLKTITELFAIAKQRKSDGQKDLAHFVLSRSSKSLNELMDKTWKMENASADIECRTHSRLDLLKLKVQEECISGCDKTWLQCAIEVLNNNHVHPYVFAAAVRHALIKGRGKFRNIMIIGPTNCGKTFILKPLENIYNTFTNPSNDKYGWVGADSAEVILLQDYHWFERAFHGKISYFC